MLDPSNILLTDKVAIVTGGGGGIGKAIALNFAHFGAHVVIADIDSPTAEQTAQEIRSLGRRSLPVPTDVGNYDLVKTMVKASVEEFGRIDILVNNVGGTRRIPFLDRSADRWQRVIDINLMSTLYCTESVSRVMIEKKVPGTIINISSIEGARAAPNYAVYAACKAGMISFTATMALELSQHGIRVNCIAPDIIATPRNETRFGSELAPRLKGAVPLGRMGSVDEVAAAAVFLASDMASYVTGITLHVDGGTYASKGWFRYPTEGWLNI